MQEKLEEFEDIRDYTDFKSRNEETLPLELAEKLVLGEESKIKVMREYRKFTVTKLAKMLEISEVYLSQIENNKRKGSIDLYKKIATALDIDLELLV